MEKRRCMWEALKKTKQHIGFLSREREEPKEASLGNGKTNYTINWNIWIRISSTRVSAEPSCCYVLYLILQSCPLNTEPQWSSLWDRGFLRKTPRHFASHLCPLKCLTFNGLGDTKAKSTFSSLADNSSNLTGLQEDRTYITLSLCPSGELKCSFLISCGWI